MENAGSGRKYLKVAITIAVVIILIYALVYVDVILRARSAYLEGEKYLSWYNNPQLKNAVIEEKYNKEKKQIEVKLTKGKIKKDEYDRQLQVIEFKKKRELEESSIKYAYVWYQTAVELFSPPESKWVKLSREKMHKAKELWRQELVKKGIKVEDYMLE
ncbi:MAG: hypothetical protein AB1633_03390 [Elusimicrobiota bacterium]